jgi:hypothetical protein
MAAWCPHAMCAACAACAVVEDKRVIINTRMCPLILHCEINQVNDMADYAAFMGRKHKGLETLPWFAAGYSVGGLVSAAGGRVEMSEVGTRCFVCRREGVRSSLYAY